MTEPRMRCGNDHHAQLTDEDRAAVEEFRAYLSGPAKERRNRYAAAIEDAAGPAARESDIYGAARAAMAVADAEHARVTAERDELLAELDGRDDEARERWIQKNLDETSLRSIDFRNGAEMEIEPARELAAHWVAAARTMLADAPNYSETVAMDVKVAESPERYSLVVQRLAPGALTPHEARQKAETALSAVLGIVAAWCTESNDVGGVDAEDLAWRLEQAGHPLPDEHHEEISLAHVVDYNTDTGAPECTEDCPSCASEASR